MKTLVVLTALVAAAIAAPALLGESFDDFSTSQSHITDILQGKRSSSLHTGFSSPSTTSHIGSANPSATGRSLLGFKKPIIIKKKVNYHLYRDSNEENAEAGSNENCLKQVKVKLCDEDKMPKKGKFADNSDDTLMTEQEIGHSIAMAKDAVEKLQRNLRKMEQGTSAKMTQWKQSESHVDQEVNEDIEIAREALQHIHNSLANLDAHSHAIKEKQAEEILDENFHLAKTEEERMAQWKEAMENIQKNAEIARNIEESFKADIHLTEEAVKEDEHMRSLHEIEHEDHDIHDHLKTEESKTEAVNNDDMNFAASELKETAMEVNKHNIGNMPVSEDKLHDEVTENTKNDKSDQKPGNDTNSRPEMSMEADKISPKMSMRATEDDVEIKEDTILKAAEHNEESSTMVKPKENELSDDIAHKDDLHIFEKSSTDDIKNQDVPKDLTQAFTTVKSGENVKTNNLVSNNAFETDLKQTDNHHMKTLEAKNIEDMDTQAHPSQQVMTVVPHPGALKAKADNSEFQQQQMQGQNFNNFPQNADPMNEFDNMAMAKSSPQGMPFHNNMHWQHMHGHGPMHHGGSHFPHGHGPHGHPGHRGWKESDDVNEMSTFNGNNDMHFNGQARQSSAMNGGEHLEGQGNNMFMRNENMMAHEGIIGHGKSSDMDTMSTDVSMHMNMRDALDKNGLSKSGPWKQFHSAARGAYGSVGLGAGAGSASGGSSAVGVFPNANVGNCALPLLLSCSPSVVSGSLAKTHPAPYSPPAYRASEDFKFHTKRDLIKANKYANIALKSKDVIRNEEKKEKY